MLHDYNYAVNALANGSLIAYPTEAVYGLGCDPFQQAAVMRLLALKGRAVAQGLILIAADWSQVADLVEPIAADRLQAINNTWPGPHTWVFPASSKVPSWIRGEHSSIAIRLTAHPIARELCRQFGGALVSTSANRSGEPPALDANSARALFSDDADVVVDGDCGDLAQPTSIHDAVSGQRYR